MAPILVHKNEAESGQHCAKSSAPERSWGSIKATMGAWWWGRVQVTHGRGEGNADQPTPRTARLVGQHW